MSTSRLLSGICTLLAIGACDIKSDVNIDADKRETSTGKNSPGAPDDSSPESELTTPASFILKPEAQISDASTVKFRLIPQGMTGTKPIQYSCLSNCPQGLTIIQQTGEVSWPNQTSNAPSLTGILFSANDGSATATALVNLVNHPAGEECTQNGQIACITNATYKAANLSNLSPANIKAGIVIAGITGNYPSSAFPLAGSSGTDLPSLSADVAVGAYQWWKRDGTRVTGSISDAGPISPGAAAQTFQFSVYRQFTVAGSATLSAENIKNGVTIFGVTGSMAPEPPTCNADGAIDCKTTADYPSVKKSDLNNGWSVRKGTTIGGLAGQLKYCRNRIDTSLYDYTAESAPANEPKYGTVAPNTTDVPPTIVAGWENYACDASNWQDVSTSGNRCTVGGGTGADVCMQRDNLTGLIWSPTHSVTRTWAEALAVCDAMTIGGVSAGTWRLPTEFEVMQATINGINALRSPHFIPNPDYVFWASTTYNNTLATVTRFTSGYLDAFSKSNSQHVTCVRSGW